jgi:hypothetical protein
MAANTTPIFSRLADIQWGAADGNGGSAGPLKTANTAMDGTGTVLTVFTADGTNGGFVQRVTAKPVGTNVATVPSVDLNNGFTNATIANNTLIGELNRPASTASNTSALGEYSYPLNLALPAGYKINVAIGTTVSAGIQVSAFGGKY